ncbi:hypothetical protein AB0B40_11420 [Streptomyces sp. NPDC042638]|uniref:hypothetical protein n=1 Tax=Streptomyces sp. NPDC042638 TaxID=3154333 RepID=UPI0033CDD1C3
MSDQDRNRQDETAPAAGRAAGSERAADEPLDHPYPELRAAARTRRHPGEAAAVADTPPGIPGLYGTTRGVRPGTGPSPARDPRTARTGTPPDEPDKDGEGPVPRPQR